MRRAATSQCGLNHLQADGRYLLEPISFFAVGRSFVKVHPCAQHRQRKLYLGTGTPFFKTEHLPVNLILDPLCF
ncbi:MAG: hypothetical protein ABSF28_05560 [Terracidiphilus sp.]